MFPMSCVKIEMDSNSSPTQNFGKFLRNIANIIKYHGHDIANC